MLSKILLGIKRSPQNAAASFIFSFTILWSLIEPIVAFLAINVAGTYKFIIFIVVSAIVTIIRIYPKSTISFRIRNTNTTIGIYFGDIFKENNCIAIGVNEFFDSHLGQLVSPGSLHGKLIQDVLGGKKELFDSAVNSTLHGEEYQIVQRPVGKKKRYKIGTTAVLEFCNTKYFLFALTQSDKNLVSGTTPDLVHRSLSGLWAVARKQCGGFPVSIPLISTGLAKSGLPPTRILELLLISILYETKKNEITGKINIVLRKFEFNSVDLRSIVNYWR